MTKNEVKIKKITINKGTLHNVSISPTNINFMFGKNATGKSTLGRCIQKQNPNEIKIEWVKTDDANTRVMLYNEDYIVDNIKASKFNGVFTISTDDVKVLNEIELLEKELNDEVDEEGKVIRDGLNSCLDKATKKKDRIMADEAFARKKAADAIWDKCKDSLKITYKLCAIPKNSAVNLLETLEKVEPEEQTKAELDRLYKAAYGEQEIIYDEYSLLTDSLPECPLLNEPLIVESNSQFLDFIKKIDAIAWVREGHIKYENNEEGVCPFCQRALDETIKNNIKNCFTDAYEEKMNEIIRFKQTYSMSCKFFMLTNAQKNAGKEFPSPEVKELSTIIELLDKTIKENIRIIEDKIAAPSNCFKLGDTKTIIDNANKLINKLNDKIKAHNAMVLDPKKKELFNAKLKGHYAAICSKEIGEYIGKISTLEKQKNSNKTELSALQSKVDEHNARLSELRKHTTSTKQVISKINNLLIESGFTSFSIKPNGPTSYSLIRSDGTPAESLSEGEKNMICFLYFYFSVFGVIEEEKGLDDRIVFIDDAASSMDSDAVFIIASLVRDIIEACKNAYSYAKEEGVATHIKQVFITSHNAFFYNEIAPMYLEDFDITNYYEITKINNDSSISLNTRTYDKDTANEKTVNFISDLGNYAGLWECYFTTDNPRILIMCMRKILESYFMQNLGMSSGSLYKDISNKHLYLFKIDKDYTNLYIARSLIGYITNQANSSVDYNRYMDDVDRMRNVFFNIFKCQGQDQHFLMMEKRYQKIKTEE